MEIRIISYPVFAVRAFNKLREQTHSPGGSRAALQAISYKFSRFPLKDLSTLSPTTVVWVFRERPSPLRWPSLLVVVT
jgi:hypothetical protein